MKQAPFISGAGNEIEDRGVEVISESLNSNYTLETLVLSNNDITEIGAAHLQTNLDGNLSLKELSLAWNLLRCGGAIGIPINGFSCCVCYAFTMRVHRVRTQNR